MNNNNEVLTNAAGIPIGYWQQQSLSLLEDYTILEKMAYCSRDRLLERVIHAVITDDIIQYTKAKFVSEVGKQTEVKYLLVSPLLLSRLRRKIVLISISIAT